ncbi:MAG: hypothetical protein ABIK73_08830 [candidate division WOR-3 bacterium]
MKKVIGYIYSSIVLIAFIFSLNGCIFQKDVTNSRKGFGSLRGSIQSFTTGIIMAKTNFYLLPIDKSSESSFPPILIGPDDNSIKGMTGQDGHFYIRDIPAGDYYLVVNTLYSYTPVVDINNNYMPLIIKVRENENRNLGTIYISYP